MQSKLYLELLMSSLFSINLLVFVLFSVSNVIVIKASNRFDGNFMMNSLLCCAESQPILTLKIESRAQGLKI